MKNFDWHRAIRAGNKFLVTVGAIALVAWLPNQAPLFICAAVLMLVPVAFILYFLEAVGFKERKENVLDEVSPSTATRHD